MIYMKQHGDIGSYEIDCIVMKCRYFNSIYNAKSYLGVNFDSDHNLWLLS